jgi:hypothetical protein
MKPEVVSNQPVVSLLHKFSPAKKNMNKANSKKANNNSRGRGRNNGNRGRGRGTVLSRENRSNMFTGFKGSSNTTRKTPARIETGDEWIQDSVSSTTFAVAQVHVNPGLASCFPRLSQIAQLYEKYRFRKLQFYYKHSVSPYGTAGTQGKILLSFDYDAADGQPADKQQMENSEPHADCMPYEDMSLNIDCRRLAAQDSKYVRAAGLGMSQDIKTYDAGVLNFASSGNASSSVVGELRVRYEIELITPVYENGLSPQPSSSVFRIGYLAHTSAFDGSNVIANLGSVGNVVVDGIGVYISNAVVGGFVQTTLVLPYGYYMFFVRGVFKDNAGLVKIGMTITQGGAFQDTVLNDDTGFTADPIALSLYMDGLYRVVGNANDNQFTLVLNTTEGGDSGNLYQTSLTILKF